MVYVYLAFFFILTQDMIFLISERKKKGERGKYLCERETSMGYLPYASIWGSNWVWGLTCLEPCPFYIQDNAPINWATGPGLSSTLLTNRHPSVWHGAWHVVGKFGALNIQMVWSSYLCRGSGFGHTWFESLPCYLEVWFWVHNHHSQGLGFFR